MKKIIFILAASFTTAIAAHAQPHFGFKGGVNIATATGDNSSSQSSMISVHAGALVQFPVASQFSIQGETVLSLEGSKFSQGGVSGTNNLTYVNIPVLAQYHVGSGFVLQAGPQMGLLLGAQEKIDKGGSTSIKDQLKSTNFSLCFGSSFTPANCPVGFDLRYNLGLSSILTDNTATIHTSTWQIGVFFMLKK